MTTTFFSSSLYKKYPFCKIFLKNNCFCNYKFVPPSFFTIQKFFIHIQNINIFLLYFSGIEGLTGNFNQTFESHSRDGTR